MACFHKPAVDTTHVGIWPRFIVQVAALQHKQQHKRQHKRLFGVVSTFRTISNFEALNRYIFNMVYHHFPFSNSNKLGLSPATQLPNLEASQQIRRSWAFSAAVIGTGTRTVGSTWFWLVFVGTPWVFVCCYQLELWDLSQFKVAFSWFLLVLSWISEGLSCCFKDQWIGLGW